MTDTTLRAIDRNIQQTRDRIKAYMVERDRRTKHIAEAEHMLSLYLAKRSAIIAAKRATATYPEPGCQVVTFIKRFGGGRDFHYAATSFTHEGDGKRYWSLTGKEGLNTVPWHKIAEFIGRDETATVTIVPMLPIPTLGPDAIANVGRIVDDLRKTFESNTIHLAVPHEFFRGL